MSSYRNLGIEEELLDQNAIDFDTDQIYSVTYIRRLASRIMLTLGDVKTDQALCVLETWRRLGQLKLDADSLASTDSFTGSSLAYRRVKMGYSCIPWESNAKMILATWTMMSCH